MAITRELLSGSTDGQNIAVAATSSPGTTIHTAHATADDEIYITAVNIDSSDHTLTLQWGGTATADGAPTIIPANAGIVLVVPGQTLTNSKIVKAYADSTNKININGWVNRKL